MRVVYLCLLLCATGCRDEPDLVVVPVTPDEPNSVQADTANTDAPTRDEINAGAGILEDALRGASGS